MVWPTPKLHPYILLSYSKKALVRSLPINMNFTAVHAWSIYIHVPYMIRLLGVHMSTGTTFLLQKASTYSKTILAWHACKLKQISLFYYMYLDQKHLYIGVTYLLKSYVSLHNVTNILFLLLKDFVCVNAWLTNTFLSYYLQWNKFSWPIFFLKETRNITKDCKKNVIYVTWSLKNYKQLSFI